MHEELYRNGRAGWLRPAVLGANDGIVSTASLVIGVAAAAASRNAVLLAGVAGLVGGATSMAAGEYVSVSSQRDAERADSSRELATDPESEQTELTEMYVRRMDRELAATVAEQLTAVDPLGSHVRDELGLQPGVRARARLRRDVQPKGMTACLPPCSQQRQECPLTCGFGTRGRIRTDDLPITRRMLGVDLVGSRRISPAHVGCLVGPDGSRRGTDSSSG